LKSLGNRCVVGVFLVVLCFYMLLTLTAISAISDLDSHEIYLENRVIPTNIDSSYIFVSADVAEAQACQHACERCQQSEPIDRRAVMLVNKVVPNVVTYSFEASVAETQACQHACERCQQSEPIDRRAVMLVNKVVPNIVTYSFEASVTEAQAFKEQHEPR
jgi:hypothetical protein